MNVLFDWSLENLPMNGHTLEVHPLPLLFNPDFIKNGNEMFMPRFLAGPDVLDDPGKYWLENVLQIAKQAATLSPFLRIQGKIKQYFDKELLIRKEGKEKPNQISDPLVQTLIDFAASNVFNDNRPSDDELTLLSQEMGIKFQDFEED